MLNDILRYFKKSFIFSLGRLSSQIVSFLLVPLYTRKLDVAGYGVLENILVINALTSIFFNLSIFSGFQRTYLFDAENENEKKEVIFTALIFSAITSVSFLTLFFATPIFGTILRFLPEGSSKIFVLFFIGNFFNSFSAVPEAYFLAEEKAFTFSILSLSRTIVVLTGNILLVGIYDYGLKGIALVALICSAVYAIGLLLYLIPKSKKRINKKLLRIMLSFSLPLVPAYLAAYVIEISDRLFITSMLSFSANGLYALAYKLSKPIYVFIITPLSAFLPPYVFKKAKNNDLESFKYILIITTCGLCMISLAISLFSKEIIYIIAGSNYLEASNLIFWLCLSYIIFFVARLFQINFNIANRTKFFALNISIVSVINLGLNYLLINAFGVIGAAYSTVISYLVLAVLNNFVGSRLIKIDFAIPQTAGIIALFVIMYFGLSGLAFSGKLASYLIVACVCGYASLRVRDAVSSF